MVFNKTTLSPPGCKVVINDSQYARRNWTPHGSEWWYIGTDMERYMCHQVYLNTTRDERVSDTLYLFPNNTKNPFMSSADCASLAAANLIEALLHPNTEAPFSQIGGNFLLSLRQISTLF